MSAKVAANPPDSIGPANEKGLSEKGFGKPLKNARCKCSRRTKIIIGVVVGSVAITLITLSIYITMLFGNAKGGAPSNVTELSESDVEGLEFDNAISTTPTTSPTRSPSAEPGSPTIAPTSPTPPTASPTSMPTACNEAMIISAESFTSTKGTARLYVHTETKTFKVGYGVTSRAYYSNFKKISAREMTWNLRLPPGEYVIVVLDDQDNDEKMDTNLLGIPNEGIAMSGDARGGPDGGPKFSDAVFTHECGKPIKMEFSLWSV